MQKLGGGAFRKTSWWKQRVERGDSLDTCILRKDSTSISKTGVNLLDARRQAQKITPRGYMAQNIREGVGRSMVVLGNRQEEGEGSPVLENSFRSIMYLMARQGEMMMMKS